MKPITDTVTKEWTVLPVVGGSLSPELPILPNPPYHALLGLYHMRDCELPKEKSTDGPPVRGSGRTLPQRVKIHGVPPLLHKVTTQQVAPICSFPYPHKAGSIMVLWGTFCPFNQQTNPSDLGLQQRTPDRAISESESGDSC